MLVQWAKTVLNRSFTAVRRLIWTFYILDIVKSDHYMMSYTACQLKESKTV